MTRVPLSIDPRHPAFAGHFPSRPIVPGVVLLDGSLRAIAAWRLAMGIDARAAHCRIGAAKFLSIVRPGEAVRLEFEASGATHDAFRLSVFAGPPDRERLALSGSITFEPAMDEVV